MEKTPVLPFGAELPDSAVNTETVHLFPCVGHMSADSVPQPQPVLLFAFSTWDGDN